MSEFKTIEELTKGLTRKQLLKYVDENNLCPHDYELTSLDEKECKNGDDADQCHKCWESAITDLKCKGDRKSKAKEVAKEEVTTKEPNDKADEGLKALKELASKVTKSDFLENLKDNKICPSMFNMVNPFTANCQKHAVHSQCKDCWEDVIKGLEFLPEEAKAEAIQQLEQPTEVVPLQTIDNSDLVAPINNTAVLAHMDKLVEEVKNLQAQQAQWKDLLKAKIEEAKAKVDEECTKLQRAIDYNMAQLKVEFNQVEAKETKTQKSIKVISGNIVLKKATENLDYDKDKLLKYAKENELNDYIKTKEEFNWLLYKKNLSVVDGNIIDTTTGEALQIDGLSVINVEEELQVK